MTAPLGIPPGERERARWVARGLLRDLEQAAPDLAARRRAQLEQIGEHWLTLVPVEETTPGQPVKVAEAALALGVKRSRIDGWRSRGLVTPYPGGVDLAECRAVLARQDTPVQGDGGLRSVG